VSQCFERAIWGGKRRKDRCRPEQQFEADVTGGFLQEWLAFFQKHSKKILVWPRWHWTGLPACLEVRYHTLPERRFQGGLFFLGEVSNHGEGLGKMQMECLL
jgi:hypothetical protein